MLEAGFKRGMLEEQLGILDSLWTEILHGLCSKGVSHGLADNLFRRRRIEHGLQGMMPKASVGVKDSCLVSHGDGPANVEMRRNQQIR